MAVYTQNSKFLDTKTIPSQQLIIEQYNDTDAVVVKSPLPDGFGTTVGSEYSTPFDTGGVNDTLRKVLFLKEVSQKPGFRMKKFYANPVPTEISFDMEFFSYYDAFTEVVVPAFLLQQMSVGRELEWKALKEDIERFIRGGVKAVEAGSKKAQEAANQYAGTDFKPDEPMFPSLDKPAPTSEKFDSGAGKLIDMFGFVVAPPMTKIKFGTTLTLDNMFITHVGVKFSNILDINGYPTHCSVSVTATPQEYPIDATISSWYGLNKKSKSGNTSSTQKPRQQ